MAGLSFGYIKSLKEIKGLIETSKIYSSKRNNNLRQEYLENWHNAVKQTIGE